MIGGHNEAITLQADSTFRVMRNGFPVIFILTVDRCRRGHLLLAVFSNKDDSRAYEGSLKQNILEVK